MRVKARRRDVLLRMPEALAQRVDIALMCCGSLGEHVSRNKFINLAVDEAVTKVFKEMNKARKEMGITND
jgi:hypothetical protein